MSVQAIAKGVRVSPRKLAPVAALVRNRTVDEALVILSHTPRRAAIPLRKTIESARANADYNHNYIPSTLRITEVNVTPSFRIKRIRPVYHGIAHPYQHKTSHIRVVVDGEIRQPKKAASKTALKEKK